MSTIFASSVTPGFSETANANIEELVQAAKNTMPARDDLYDDLIDLYSEAKNENWAGYPSAPVSKTALEMTQNIINALPAEIPNPTIGLDPDGEVTLEWYKDTSHIISVSTDKKGFLHYAALIGQRKHHGVEPYYGEFPNLLTSLIRLL